MKPQLYLINGPLGAGKTTVLKYLLSLPEFKDSRIIENEFANYSVDTDQLHDHESEIQTIAGVCICCSTGDELIEALNSLTASSQPVIIEATGVANSLRLVEKLALGDVFDRYDLAHGLFVLDGSETAVAIPGTLAKYKNELLAADTVLVSKTDLLSAAALQDLEDALHDLGVERYELSLEGSFNTDLLQGKSGMLEYFANFDEEIKNHDADTSYSVVELSDHRLSPDELKVLWEILRDRYGLKRMKGNFVDATGKKWHVEATPSQVRFDEGQTSDSRIVFIGTEAYELTTDMVITAGASR